MCCDKTSDNRINHLHELALRPVYNDNLLTFQKLLEKDHSATIHVRNLRILATELCKAKENLAALIQYNLRSHTDFQLESVKTVNCCLRHSDILVQKYGT